MEIACMEKKKQQSAITRKKHTLSAENIRGGTVKGRRLGPPFIILFFTVHMIWRLENENIRKQFLSHKHEVKNIPEPKIYGNGNKNCSFKKTWDVQHKAQYFSHMSEQMSDRRLHKPCHQKSWNTPKSVRVFLQTVDQINLKKSWTKALLLHGISPRQDKYSH